ncbi:MAG: phosphoribosylamine--glycine ligase [Bacteroidetes bacterium]|nr:phosphoribosylamine--glycine ligase [Bacteroidota bacterium]
MKVLVIGSGGREHALVWALSRIPGLRLYCAPGNPGTAQLAQNVPISAEDIAGLLAFARQEGIDCTVVGPEAPLVNGIADAFHGQSLRLVGPSAAAARLEGSKAFAKAFMRRWQIPTAPFGVFDEGTIAEACRFLRTFPGPYVLKADGLAGGKGVIITDSIQEAEQVLTRMLRGELFGQAGRRVVIERFLRGQEASVFALVDGERYGLLLPAQDHKRISEGDTGPNTGGMGAYAPTPLVDEAAMACIRERILEPTLAGMAAQGTPYTGFLYVGLMLTDEGPYVIEYNCRLGDPEAQVVLPLWRNPELMLEEHLPEGIALEQEAGYAACVVLASSGYPGPYQTGFPISGLDQVPEGVLVFHAGTRQDASGALLTAGGRVLGLTGLGGTLAEALERAYAAAQVVRFSGMCYRRDIGRKALELIASPPHR